MGETDPLPDEPRVFSDRLRPVSGLARRLPRPVADESPAAKKELADRGCEPIDQLVHHTRQEEYGKTIRKHYAGKALLITSDEPWIPWEVVRPSPSTTPAMSLRRSAAVRMFHLSRWLAGRCAPIRSP